MTVNLYEDLKIIKKATWHRGSVVITYALFHIKETHMEELRRFVGSQKATEQAVDWLLKMKVIQVRKQLKDADQRYAGFYSLTPSGQKIAHSLNETVQVVKTMYVAIDDHKKVTNEMHPRKAHP